MRWSQVEIEDLTGNIYKGDTAQDFALNNIDARVIIKPFSEDKFALTVDKKNLVAPDVVQRALSDGLAGRVRRVTVAGVPTPPQNTFVPKKTTVNPINIKPQYEITFELGDIDALFDPINSATEPWKEKGVQQRLQVLGYLYTPLEHPENKAPNYHHAKACWEYYKRVHKGIGDGAAVDKLKQEVASNLIAETFPTSGQVLPKSKLPAPESFAVIRFPGGYCTTKSPVTGLRAGDHFFNNSAVSRVPEKYDFRIGYRRSDIEKLVFEENKLLGKLPLIAKVIATWPDGAIKPVNNIPVYFQLVQPEVLPNDHPMRAPDARNKVMNYSIDPGAFSSWQKDPLALALRIKTKEAEYDKVRKIKDEEFRDESFTPDEKVWVDSKTLASKIYKDAVKQSQDKVNQKLEEANKKRAEA